MKRVIYADAYDASNYEEAKRNYEESKRQYDEYEVKQQKLFDLYKQDKRDAAEPIRQYLIDFFGKFGYALDEDFGLSINDWHDYIQVRINVKTNMKFSYDVTFSKDNGEVKREYSSWDRADLSQSEDIVKLQKVLFIVDGLNNADWASVLDIEFPSYSDSKYKVPEEERPSGKYPQESVIDDALIQDLMGTNNWMYCYVPTSNNYDSPWYYSYGKAYVRFLGETSKRYKIEFKNRMNYAPEKVQVTKDKIAPVMKNGDYIIVSE